jgi:hypothetical protein
MDPNELAAESLAANDPTAWFERLYQAAQGGEAVVPWDRGAPHRLLVEWAEQRRPDGAGRRAVVVGAGVGDDAEFVSGLGFDTLAFDVAPTALRAARERYPDSRVDYRVANLLDPPAEWRHAFDLVVENITVQSMPRSVREQATANVTGLVAPGGTLLVISAALGPDDDPEAGPPWPLTRAELEAFAGGRLETVGIELTPHPDVPGAQRWRAEFEGPA